MYRVRCLIALSLLALLCLVGWAAPPAAEKPVPKKEDPKAEIRAPFSTGGKREEGILERMQNQLYLGYVLKVEEAERAPRFASEPTKRGLRVVCNEIGNHYSYEIAGKSVREGKKPYSVWLVDGRFLNTLSYRLRADQPLDADKPFRARRAVDEKSGIQFVKGSLKVLKYPGGERAEYWEAVPTAKAKAPANVKKYQIGLTFHGRTELTFVCVVRDGDDEKQSARLVRETVLSLKRLPDLPSNKAALTIDYLLENGLTLKQHLALQEGMIGKKHGALVNGDLAAFQDRRLPRAVVLSGKDLVDHVRMRLLAGRQSPRGFRLYDADLADDDELRQVGLKGAGRLSAIGGQMLSATVFDGATAHTFLLEAYDRKLGGFVYWEPWAKGTFLGKGNNKAGLAARPYPGESRYFWLTDAELGRVLYSVQYEWDAVQDDRTLRALLRRPEEKALAELKKLHETKPKGLQTEESRLRGAGQSCLVGGDAKSAASAFQACRELYPTCVEAIIGLGDARLEEGKTAEANVLYRDALVRLAKDTRFASRTKARLAITMRKHLTAGGAK